MHWAIENHDWTIEKSLNSSKVTIWAACGHPEIIGLFIFEGSVNTDFYLDMITKKFFPAFQLLQNLTQIIFMQDGAPH